MITVILLLMGCPDIRIGATHLRYDELCWDSDFVGEYKYWHNYYENCQDDIVVTAIGADGACYGFNGCSGGQRAPYERDPFFLGNECPADYPDCCNISDVDIPMCPDDDFTLPLGPIRGE